MSLRRGIWSAALTPVTADLEPDAPRAIAYYRDLLGAGCDGLNLLGTTGEAMSFAVNQRLAFMDAIASSDLPKECIMVGTGASSLADAIVLTRGAFDFGFAAALVLPPFYFRDASDEGIVGFFDALFAHAWRPGARVVLYNFPRMSGVTFHPSLVERLLSEFAPAIAGIKDSSNDRRLQAELRARHPELAIYPGSEAYLLEAKAYGASGCISGTVSLWPRLAKDAFNGDDAKMQMLRQRREALDGLPLIAAVRYLTAKARNDAAWERPMPPLSALSSEQRPALEAALQSAQVM